MMNSFTQELLSTVVFILLLGPTTTNGQQFFFCRSLENNTWAGFVDAIQDSYRLAVLCPFVIEGSGCPREDEYPEGLALTSGMIIECDPDLNDRFDEHANTKCVIDCPGRHFTVYPSSPGLILTNMVLSGATNTSIYVKPEATLEVVNIHFNKYVGVCGIYSPLINIANAVCEVIQQVILCVGARSPLWIGQKFSSNSAHLPTIQPAWAEPFFHKET